MTKKRNTKRFSAWYRPRAIVLASAILGAIVALTSCGNPFDGADSADGTTGSVRVSINAPATTARYVVTPDAIPTPDAYRATLSREGVTDVTETTTIVDDTTGAATVEVTDVALGNWTLVVEAFTGGVGGTLVGQSDDIDVSVATSDQVVAVAAAIRPLVTEAGTGTVDVRYSWPPDMVSRATITVIPYAGGEAIDIGTPTFNYTAGTAALNRSIAAGDYRIKLELFDADDAPYPAVSGILQVRNGLTSALAVPAITAEDLTMAPSAPDDLTYTVGEGDASIALTWTDTSAGEEGFRIYRDSTLVGATAPSETSWTDTSPGDLPITYRLSAWNFTYGESAVSELTISLENILARARAAEPVYTTETDSAESVTSRVIIESWDWFGISLSWTSSDTDVILLDDETYDLPDGTVLRPSGADVEVTLTKRVTQTSQSIDETTDYPQTVKMMTSGVFRGGAGTADAPYLVETADQLDMVRNYLTRAYRDTHFRQIADIDLGVAPWNTGWEPIGSNESTYPELVEGYSDRYHFYGTYDGGGHAIRNLTVIVGPTSSREAGLFGSVAGGTIADVHLRDVAITALAGAPTSYAGSLVGLLQMGTIAPGESRTSRISDCTVYGASIAMSASYTGGLLGSAGDGTTVEDVHLDDVAVSTTSADCTGGLAGYMSLGSVISGARITSLTIEATGGDVGGVAGILANTSVSRSEVVGAITIDPGETGDDEDTDSDFAGGIVGNLYSFGPTDDPPRVEQCSFIGSITSNIVDVEYPRWPTSTNYGTNIDTFTGGLVGISNDDRAVIADSYAIATIEAKSVSGGLVGQLAGTVTNCYASVSHGSSTGFVGALFGGKPSTDVDDVTDTYYDLARAPLSNETYANANRYRGRSHTELKTATTFDGWDTSVWTLSDGSYPHLSWQDAPFAITEPAAAVAALTPPEPPTLGMVEVFAGDGTAAWVSGAEPQVCAPNLIATDASGNAYVWGNASSSHDYHLWKITSTGEMSAFAGSAATLPADGGLDDGSGFRSLSDICVEADGSLLVVDTWYDDEDLLGGWDESNGVVRRVQGDGFITTLDLPAEIKDAPDEYRTQNITITSATSDPDGNVYVLANYADTYPEGIIWKYHPDTVGDGATLVFDSHDSISGLSATPKTRIRYHDGYLYAIVQTYTGGPGVARISADEVVGSDEAVGLQTIAGHLESSYERGFDANGPNSNATFTGTLSGLAVTSEGDRVAVYLTEYFVTSVVSSVRKVLVDAEPVATTNSYDTVLNLSGWTSTVAGFSALDYAPILHEGPVEHVTYNFSTGSGIAIDPTTGDLLVADLGNNRIKRITLP